MRTEDFEIKDGVLIKYHGSDTDVVIPDGVTSIGDEAFYLCDSLKNVTIPDSVTEIGNRAFTHCSSLESITIPDSVTNIGYLGLGEFTLILRNGITKTSIKFTEECYTKDGDLNSKTQLTIDFISADEQKRKEIFPELQKEHKYPLALFMMFAHNDDFYTSFVKRNIRGIIKFYIDINIPYVIAMLLPFGFVKEENIQPLIDYAIEKGRDDIKELLEYWNNIITDFIIAGYKIFGYKGNDKNVVIPDCVTAIGLNAFACCFNIESIDIPESITEIGDMAFFGCYKLKSITIPDSVTKIGGMALYDCSGLESVTIPETIKGISGVGFHNAYCTLFVKKGNLSVPLVFNRDCYENVYGMLKSKPQLTLDFIDADKQKREEIFPKLKKEHKYPLAILLALAYDDDFYKSFIKKYIKSIVKYYIDICNTDMINMLLPLGFITKRNIDSLIDYALEQHTKKTIKLLTDYRDNSL